MGVILYSRVGGFGEVYYVWLGGRCLGVFFGFYPPFFIGGDFWGFCGDFWSGKVDISITACSSCIGKGIGAILIKAEAIRKNEAKLGNEIGDIEEIGIRRDK